MSNSLNMFLPCVLAVSLAACGGQNENTETQQNVVNKSPLSGVETGTQTLSFDLNVRSALAAGISASNAKVTITKGDLQRTQNVNLDGDSASVSFNSLPIGEYQIAIQVMDGTTVVAQGSGTANVNADIQSEIDLVLNAVTGNLQVNLCMPDSAAEYQGRELISTIKVNPDIDSVMAAFVNAPKVASVRSSLVNGESIKVNYSTGNGPIAGKVVDGGEAPYRIDHGAGISIKSGSKTILALNGCGTQVAYFQDNDGLWVSYKLNSDFSAKITPKVNGSFFDNVAVQMAGGVPVEGLAVTLEFKDSNNDADLSDKTKIEDIDFSKFETVKLRLVTPGLLRSLEGLAGSVLKSVQGDISYHEYLAESEDIQL